MKIFDMISLILNEKFSVSEIPRTPEPTSEMNDSENIEAFHQQGDQYGSLIPIYHFNALATSRLIPKDGTLVDLGSGTGQYLAYLAQFRPDIKIIGIELAENMVEFGNYYLLKKGLNDRVKLILGDMTVFFDSLDCHIDLVSSVFSLHHLPSLEKLAGCTLQLKKARQTYGSAIWIFDHARPRHKNTPSVFPEIFTPNANHAFKIDSKNSLAASFSYQELCRALNDAKIGRMYHDYSRLLNLYQIHWLECYPALSSQQKIALPIESPPLKDAEKDFRYLKLSFKEFPKA